MRDRRRIRCSSCDVGYGMNGPTGKRGTCVCGRAYIVGKQFPFGPIVHVVMRHSRGARKRGVWLIDESMSGRQIYVTCPVCACIEKIFFKEITDGYARGLETMSCIDCRDCHHHYWPYLDGWKEEYRHAKSQKKPKKKAAPGEEAASPGPAAQA